MKITKAEVRTTYTVEVTFREWWDVLKISDRETIEDARKRFEQFPLWLNTDAGRDYPSWPRLSALMASRTLATTYLRSTAWSRSSSATATTSDPTAAILRSAS